MKTLLLVLQTFFALLLTVLIFVQLRGSGISRGHSGGVAFTRRGLDKLIFRLTFIVSLLLLLTSLSALFL